MWRPFSRRMSVAAVVALTTALTVSAGSAFADEHLVLPAGLACDFALGVDALGGDKQVDRIFEDANGNKVREIMAGVGFQITFTNLDTGATIAFPANGAVAHVVYNADGSKTVTLTGHNLLILFPTDVPPGPSTTIYVGRVVFTVDTNNDFTVQSASGKPTDICAALS